MYYKQQIKMSLKGDIEHIFQKNTGYAQPEHAINQAESLKSLSIDLYTDSKRFVYELLQNADDSVLPNELVKVGIRLFDDFLVVAHTGKPFDKRDLRGICGVSDGTKRSLIEKTGYKGIGFKSVFGQSKKVTIYTDGEYFRFDADFNFAWNSNWGVSQEIWEKENERQFLYPWQIIPIFTSSDEVDERIKSFLYNEKWTVATIVLLSKGKEDVKNAIQKLSSNVNMFLFLKNIEELDFNLGTSNIITLHRDYEGKAVNIKQNGNIVAFWILKTVILQVPIEVKSKLIEERNIPDKLLHANETELTFAAKLGEDGIQRLNSNEQFLYSYLPTEEIKYKMPVLVNSSFVISANRETLHEDSKWNQWLFEYIPFELLKWVAELVKSNYGYQAYELLPSSSSISNSLASAYKNGLSKALETIPFILSNQNELIRINQAVIDFTSISKKPFITEDVIRNFVIKKFARNTIHPNPFLPYTNFENTLKNIGVACFEWDDVSKLLESDVFIKSHSLPRNTQLIQFFKQLSEDEKPKNITDSVIKHWSFILDHRRVLNRPNNIYFPTPDDKNWNDSFSEISFLHGDIQNWLLENPEVRTWLEKLGVIERTDLSYLRKTIIENASTYSTNENSIPTILNIFSLYVKGAIGKEELGELSELKLLTSKGALLPAKSCYFSDAYSPRLKLNSFLDDDIFISEKYINTSSDKDEWRRFFKMMGVKEGITFITYEKTNKNILIHNYNFNEEYFNEKDKQFRPLYTTFYGDAYLNLTNLNFLSKTSQYGFSKTFWYDVINNLKLEDFNSPTIVFWGNSGYPGRETGNERGNYVKWFIQNKSCIPTVMETCNVANSVFLNSEDIIKIAGNYLPVFNGVELSPDWRAFFGFKTILELSDYLVLLTAIVADRTENDKSKVENNERIQFIYEWFLNSCANFSMEEISAIRKWSEESFLPDKKGYIFKCKDLNYFIDGDVSIFQGEFPFIFINASNRKHRELETFLQLFNIKILRQSEFKLNHSEKEELFDLQNRLETILPYLIKWLEKTEQDNLTENISKLASKINALKIFTSETLEITYGDEWTKAVQVHFDSNILHVTTPWNSNKAMLNLPEQLCRYLDIKGYEKELEFLLRVEKIQEINDYFSQEGITLPQSHSNLTFSESEHISNQIVLTPEFLASAGISTQEELEERLKDPNFAKAFTHISTSSYIMLQYALEKIERAKKKIIAHLSMLPEYDCSNYDEVSNSIIGGIEKNGEEIFIVTRPSDNNEIIIYYQAEFDTLEYAESELWYENGIDKPEKLTLGKILKVTGFNRIPI